MVQKIAGRFYEGHWASPSSWQVHATTGKLSLSTKSGCIAQSVAHLTQEPEVPVSIPGLATYFHFSFC